MLPVSPYYENSADILPEICLTTIGKVNCLQPSIMLDLNHFDHGRSLGKSSLELLDSELVDVS